MAVDDTLGLALYDAGLIQFGRFVTEVGVHPFQEHLAMLASYPALLAATAVVCSAHLGSVDRLFCTVRSMPLGVALSLHTDIPLVIAQGTGRDGARDFVGAYDIGHPAVLIVNSLADATSTLIGRAAVWGLQIRTVVAVLDGGSGGPAIPSSTMVQLEVLAATLVRERRLPTGLAAAVTAWLKAPSTHPRPG